MKCTLRTGTDISNNNSQTLGKNTHLKNLKRLSYIYINIRSMEVVHHRSKHNKHV